MPKWLVRIAGEIEVEADTPDEAVEAANEALTVAIGEADPMYGIAEVLDFTPEEMKEDDDAR